MSGKRGSAPTLSPAEVAELWQANRALLQTVAMEWKSWLYTGSVVDSTLLGCGWSLVFVQAFEILRKADGERLPKNLSDARNRIAHATNREGLIGREECLKHLATIETRLRAIGKLTSSVPEDEAV